MTRTVKRVRPALQVTGLYVIIAGLWILYSDRFLEHLAVSSEILTRLQTFKGLAFVAVTGCILYFVMDRLFRATEASRDALREQNRRLATLFSNLSGMAYRCANDPDWTVEFVSEGVRDLTGYEAEDLIGNRKVAYGDLIHPEDREAVWEQVQGALSRREPFQLVYRVRTSTGQVRWVLEQGRGVFHPEGGLDAIEGFISDITQVKHLEAQFRQAQKLEAVGRLAGGVAHDFNNLLTAIGGNSRLLQRKLGGEHPALPNVSEIEKAVEKGAGLTRRLLAFSRRQPLTPEHVNLNTVVADVEDLLVRLLGGDVELKLEYGSEAGWVRADRNQLEQVLMNLVVNARDAMPSGGALTVAVGGTELGPKEAEAHELPPGRYETLAVSDTGTGIEPEVLSRIFEPFFTTKEEGKGTGLGLSTVYGIVKQSQGHIEVTSGPDRGTTFTVYLPRAEASGGREPGNGVMPPVPPARESGRAAKARSRTADRV
jgi:two-component system cell cycle sensor histidine kinase/response regulator CckA